jgi:hypothetical protein
MPWSENDYLVQMDGDGQHDPALIPALLAPVTAGRPISRWLAFSWRRDLQPSGRGGSAAFDGSIRLSVMHGSTSGYQPLTECDPLFTTEVFRATIPTPTC